LLQTPRHESKLPGWALKAKHLTVACNKAKVRFNSTESISIFKEITATGSYEPYVLLFSLVQPGDVFVDVSANLGALSLPVAK
jgi:hypothetical protein